MPGRQYHRLPGRSSPRRQAPLAVRPGPHLQPPQPLVTGQVDELAANPASAPQGSYPVADLGGRMAAVDRENRAVRHQPTGRSVDSVPGGMCPIQSAPRAHQARTASTSTTAVADSTAPHRVAQRRAGVARTATGARRLTDRYFSVNGRLQSATCSGPSHVSAGSPRVIGAVGAAWEAAMQRRGHSHAGEVHVVKVIDAPQAGARQSQLLEGPSGVERRATERDKPQDRSYSARADGGW